MSFERSLTALSRSVNKSRAQVTINPIYHFLSSHNISNSLVPINSKFEIF